ncbi:MAG: c-type cytochrome [Proteobacteria bacterium]|nr:c-type cytochrome [Pseudomonadota bacterium]MDA1331491.1 c-type cytochrome [Pseudomonadota bacterium]
MIRTPKQLITVVVLAFAVPLTIILLIVQFITAGIKVDPNSSTMSAQAIAKRMDPLNANGSNKVPVESNSKSVAVTLDPGETLYNTVCQACHSAGIAGAPKTGDKTAWSERIRLGNDTLSKSVINGKNMMPARGGATNASNDDIRAAVDFMLSKVK